MSKIVKQDTNGVKPLLAVGELGYDNYPSGGDIGRVYVGNGSINIPQAKKSEVIAVDGKIDTHVIRVDNPHAVTKAQVGLSNVDNTSDVNKPVSTPTQNALDLKQNVLVSGTNIKTIEGQSIVGPGNIDLSKSDVGLSNVDNTADSAKVVNSASKWTTSRLINGTAVDGTIDITTSQWGTSRNITIGNTAKSVNGSADASWSLAEIGAIGTASPAFTGTPTGPTALVSTSTSQLATTAFVNAEIANATYSKAQLDVGQLDNRYYTEAEIDTLYDTAVKLTGNQTIAGIKTFSSAIVGNITGNSGTATNATNVSGGYGTFSGLISTKVNNASFAGANDATLSVRGDATYSAIMSFHRAGAFAVNFGLDTDNKLKVGGWSMGSVYEIYHQGNPQPITGLGIGQTWQDVTASRVLGTTYTNSTGKPIMVAVQGDSAGAFHNLILLVDGTPISHLQHYVSGGSGSHITVTTIIPTGSTYSVANYQSTGIVWKELR